jgi:predicted dehydrogenase
MKRVGIVGAGTMGGTHAYAWRTTEAELVGFFDLEPRAAQQAAERFEVAAFPSREALFDAVDIVDVCTPTYTHREVAIAALQAGKHVVCEKPMSLTVEGCADMIRAAEANGVRLFIAQVVRFFPEYATAKRLVDEGAIGKLGVIRLTRGGANPGTGPRQWFVEEYRSGGVLLDLMVHDYDYARWLAGDVERVFCQRHLGPGADYALVTLRFRSGAIAHVEGSWAYPSGFRTAYDIAGDAGLLTFNSERAVPLQLRLKEQQAGAGGVVVPSSPLFPEDSPYARELQHFYQCLETGEEFLVTPLDAMAAVQIANAARESAITGTPVALQPLSI